MQTARLTSKGQLVIPKNIRDRLHIRPGTDFAVTAERGRIVLAPRNRKKHRLEQWTDVNPRNTSLTAQQLSEPISTYERE